MNVGGVLMLGVHRLARAERARRRRRSPSSYTQLFSLITWTSVGLMGAAAAVAGQNLGAGQPDRADKAVHVAARIGSWRGRARGLRSSCSSRASCSRSSA